MTTETNNYGIVHDLKSSEFKALIERVAGLNFKIEDNKSTFDKLFYTNEDTAKTEDRTKTASEFVNQLQRMADNISAIASAYKKELDTAKSSGISSEIDGLSDDVRQQLIDDLINKGYFQNSVGFEKKKTSNKGQNLRLPKQTTTLVIGEEEHIFNTDKKSYIAKSFIGLESGKVNELFRKNKLDLSLLNLKGEEGKAAKVTFIEQHKKDK